LITGHEKRYASYDLATFSTTIAQGSPALLSLAETEISCTALGAEEAEPVKQSTNAKPTRLG
jgi:hypothetical protein